MSSNLCRPRCEIGFGGTEVTAQEFDLIQFQTGNIRYFDILNSFIAAPDNWETPIARVIRSYGSEAFSKAIVDVNNFFKNKPVDANTYPLLSQRVSVKTDFIPIEIASFIEDLEYDPTDLSRQTQINNNKLLQDFENFYTKDFSKNGMGSFCSILPNVFGAIGGFFTAVEGLTSLLGDAKALAEKLKNFNLKAELKNLLNTLKENIKNVVDKVVEKAKSQLQNIKLAFQDIESFIKTKIASKFQEVKVLAEGFFKELNVENLKKKFEGLIDYASNIFKNPTLEDIQFLLFRFCGFVSKIEDAIKGVLSPLQNMKDNLSGAINSIQINTAGVSRNAALAGAIRLTPAQRAALRNRAIGANPTRPAANGGAGDNPSTRQTYNGEPLGEYGPLTPEDLENEIKWNDGNGEPGLVVFAKGSNSFTVLGEEMWSGCIPELRASLRLVAQVFGKELIINSAYRPNAPRGPYRNFNTGVGGKYGGRHPVGDAADITWRGFTPSEAEDFLVIARYFGYRGIGRYTGNVHIDFGSARSWGIAPAGAGEGGAEKVAAFKGQKSPAQTAQEQSTGPTAENEPAVNEDRGYTSQDVASVEKWRQIDQGFGENVGSGSALKLTDGERAYAKSRGYL